MIEFEDGFDEELPGSRRQRLRRVSRWLRNLMRDRPASTYSPISPRKPDGTRGPIFPFNGNGNSR